MTEELGARPQPPALPGRWAATIAAKLRERGLDCRPVRYEVVEGSDRLPASWPEVEAWLADAERRGSRLHGFALLDEGPGPVTVLFSRMTAGGSSQPPTDVAAAG
jgi:hypothetical protein